MVHQFRSDLLPLSGIHKSSRTGRGVCTCHPVSTPVIRRQLLSCNWQRGVSMVTGLGLVPLEPLAAETWPFLSEAEPKKFWDVGATRPTAANSLLMTVYTRVSTVGRCLLLKSRKEPTVNPEFKDCVFTAYSFLLKVIKPPHPISSQIVFFPRKRKGKEYRHPGDITRKLGQEAPVAVICFSAWIK